MESSNETYGYSLFKKLPRECQESIYPDEGSPASPLATKLDKALAADKFMPNINCLDDLISFSTRQSGESDRLIYSHSSGTAKDILNALDDDTDMIPLHISKAHHRAATLPLTEPIVDHRVEEYGVNRYDTINAYSFINIKGPGYIFPQHYHSKVLNYHGSKDNPTVMTKHSEQYPWGDQVLGMFDIRIFEALRRSTEELIRAGCRVEAIAKAVKIDSCYYEGELRSIDELKAQGVIPSEEYEGEAFKAVQVIRLQRFPYRIIDLYQLGKDLPKKEQNKLRKELIDEVFDSLNRENKALNNGKEPYDSENPESVIQYLVDTGHWIGKNLGIIQGLGKYMGFFNSGNITLSTGELVDLDTLEDLKATSDINVAGVPIYDKKSATTFETFQVDSGNDKELYTYNYRDIPPAMLKDIRDAVRSLYRLFNTVQKLYKFDEHSARQRVFESFISGYQEGRSNHKKLEKKNFSQLDYIALDSAVADLTRKIILENRNIKPIKV